MSEPEPAYRTSRIEDVDAKSGFSCGKHALDDYFARHAVANDRAGIGRTAPAPRPEAQAGAQAVAPARHRTPASTAASPRRRQEPRSPSDDRASKARGDQLRPGFVVAI
jgi:hypothetical protein